MSKDLGSKPDGYPINRDLLDGIAKAHSEGAFLGRAQVEWLVTAAVALDGALSRFALRVKVVARHETGCQVLRDEISASPTGSPYGQELVFAHDPEDLRSDGVADDKTGRLEVTITFPNPNQEGT